MRMSWWTPADGAAGHRAGHAHQHPAEPGRPVGGVERAAADRRLDDDGALRQRGDQPVAGQEPDPWSARSPGPPRRRPRRRRRCSRAAAGGRRDRHGRRRRRARRRSDPRAASAPRCAAWSMPKAAPETTVCPASASAAAMSPGDARRRRWSRTGTRPPRPTASRPGRADRAPSPTARSARRRARADVGAWARSARASGHSSSAGTTHRMPRRSARSSSALDVDPGEPGGEVVSRAVPPDSPCSRSSASTAWRRARRPARRAAGRRARRPD